MFGIWGIPPGKNNFISLLVSAKSRLAALGDCWEWVAGVDLLVSFRMVIRNSIICGYLRDKKILARTGEQAVTPAGLLSFGVISIIIRAATDTKVVYGFYAKWVYSDCGNSLF